MSVDNTNDRQPGARRPLWRVGAAGIALGMLAAIGGAHAAQTAVAMAQVAAGAADPAKQIAGAVSVSNIDFKRGDGGSGRLILHFSGDGAVPDLRTQGAAVLIDVPNVQLPAALQKPIDVRDFATPVNMVQVNRVGAGAQVVLDTSGAFEPMAYQTGRDYIVEIVPRAATNTTSATSAVAAPAGRAMGASVNQPAVSTSDDLTPHYTGAPISFDFQDTPVRQVLQLLAEQSNLNIAVSDSVQGNITLRLKNVPWDQALDIVLDAKGLDKRRNGNVVWIAPQAEIAASEDAKESARLALEEKAEMITKYIPVNYGNAEDIAKLLTDESKGSSGGGGSNAANASRGFLSSRGSLSYDRRTNTLLVIDIPKRVAAIEDLVRSLDRPVDQVVIEARIVIATESFARELGAKFGVSGSNNHTYYSGNLDSNYANANSAATAALANQTAQNTYNQAVRAWTAAGSDPATEPVRPTPVLQTLTRGLNINLPATLAGAGSLALSILNAGYLLDLELSAMQTEGRGEVISNPRIVTSNQKEADIKQGQEVGYLTLTGIGQGASQAVPQVQFKDVLLELKVTPTITNDNRVFLDMNVTKDEVSGYVDTGAGQVPTIAKREVNTAVLVDDGQTVAIGGVYEFKDQKDVSKVPFLGDIPILGNLFKKHSRTKEKAELLVFVTPKVIRVAQR